MGWASSQDVCINKQCKTTKIEKEDYFHLSNDKRVRSNLSGNRDDVSKQGKV